MKGRRGHVGCRSPYEKSFREQVARDYLGGDLSYAQVAEKYDLPGRETVKEWVKVFRKNSELPAIPLPPMTEKEKRDKAALEKRLKELEKQLEHERLRNLALETLIDVAEEELEVDIRKKPGTKQSDD